MGVPKLFDAAHAALMAQVALRWQALHLPPPRRSEFRDAAPVGLHLVHVRKERVPDAARPLEWLPLTNLAVQSNAEAERVPAWYRLRWRIEDWHRVLMSACKVEYLGHRKGKRIECAVTINAVIARRLAAMTLLGRETPELPAAILYSNIEIMALRDFARNRKVPAPDDLGRAVLAMAMLRRELNRRKDPPPGHQKVWEGYTRPAIAAQAYETLIAMGRSSDSYQRLCPDQPCV